MAGEIQIGGTTFATESSGTITVANVNSATNRTNLGLGTLATQSAVTTTDLPTDSILNIESVIKTSVFTTTSTSFTDVTGLSVGITPSSASNKILVMCSFFISANSASGYPQAKLQRNNSDVYVGDASSSRTRGLLNAPGYSNDGGYMVPCSFQFLDSPASASLQTFKLQVRQTSGNTVRIGATGLDSDSVAFVRSASSIVLLEIKG